MIFYNHGAPDKDRADVFANPLGGRMDKTAKEQATAQLAAETKKLLDDVANKPRDNALVCAECGADFTCRTGAPGECWCNTSPNMRPQFRLDGTCVCPDCLAMGQLDELKKARADKRAKRAAQKIIK